MNLIKLATREVGYSTWWAVADKHQEYMRRCELMVKLVCHASLLRRDDMRFKNAPFGSKCCIMCHHAAYECTTHMIMQCDGQNDRRRVMYEEIYAVQQGIENLIDFGILLGGYIEGWSFDDMKPIWMIACTHISQMYYAVLNMRRE